MSLQQAIQKQYEVILDRRKNGGEEKSYTSYLFAQGLNKILKKCCEECFEAVVAAKNEDVGEIVGELNDLLYHVTVLLCHQEVPLEAVMADLNTRCQTQGEELDRLAQVIAGRRGQEGESYTAYLFEQGLDKVLKKVGEACGLLLIAAKDGDRDAVARETGDLLYHLLVMMECRKIPLEALTAELDRRSQKTGNLKTFHQSDHNT